MRVTMTAEMVVIMEEVEKSMKEQQAEVDRVRSYTGPFLMPKGDVGPFLLPLKDSGPAARNVNFEI